MLFKCIARLSICPILSFSPMRYFFFPTSGSSSSAPTPPKNTIKCKQKLQSQLYKEKNRPFINLLNSQRYSFCNMGYYFDHFQILGFQKYPLIRDNTWKNAIIQSLEKGADVTFRQPKLKQLQELRFNIKQNRSTTFQSLNQYIITPKSQVQLDKRLNKENMLPEQQAIAYIKKVLQQNPKSEKYTESIETYQVHKVATVSIGKNLKNLFAKCDQHPGEYCIANPRKRPDYEFIDFIIAKKQLDKYHIFTFNASILRKKAKIQDAKALFAELISRQTGKPNYMINHIALCHKDAQQQIPYDPNRIFNIFYSPWDEITFKSTKNPMSLKILYQMININNSLNGRLKRQEEKEQ